MIPALGVALTGAGAGLVYAALTGQNPIDELRKALTTGTTDGRPDPQPFGGGAVGAARSWWSQATDLARRASGSGAVVDRGADTPAVDPKWPDDPTTLVSIGQGSHRLAAPAAAAFAAVQAAYGRKIPVTDSYRSLAQQEASYARDPSRFAKPGNSAHTEGRAVDVNLPALGLNPRGEPNEWMRDAAYARLVNAFTSMGWCNYQIKNGTANGRTREPWHFSFGVCK